MKTVKKYINEKFIEDSYLVKDMGIGISLKFIKKWINEETDFQINNYPESYYIATRTN